MFMPDILIHAMSFSLRLVVFTTTCSSVLTRRSLYGHTGGAKNSWQTRVNASGTNVLANHATPDHRTRTAALLTLRRVRRSACGRLNPTHRGEHSFVPEVEGGHCKLALLAPSAVRAQQQHLLSCQFTLLHGICSDVVAVGIDSNYSMDSGVPRAHPPLKETTFTICTPRVHRVCP